MNNRIPTREASGQILVQMGKENDSIIVCEADIGKSTKTCYFAKEFPERYVNVGIAEQNLMNMAVGLASTGKTVFASTYSVFASMRACEQIRTFACYPNINIKIMASHGGLTPGSDGPTHQAIEDMGVMRSIPNMCVMMPADFNSTKALVRGTLDWKTPVFVRLTRDAVPCIYGEDETFEIGKGKIVKEGNDVSIIANGDMVYHSLKAVEVLSHMGISARVVDMHTIKPIDTELVLDCCKKTGAIVTVEDHNILNGLGSAVAEIIAEQSLVPLHRVGIKDQFAESGDYQALLDKYGLSVTDIVNAATAVIARK
ncbi:MAG: transketolase family protein [Clostridia bacterium]|nr:transketolase family protein [Clostridia bacterium]